MDMNPEIPGDIAVGGGTYDSGVAGTATSSMP
jgi:hypothetical protein